MPYRNPLALPPTLRQGRRSTDTAAHSNHNESTDTLDHSPATPVSIYTLPLLGTRVSRPALKNPFGGVTNNSSRQHSTDSSDDDGLNNNSNKASISQKRLKSHTRSRHLSQQARAFSPASAKNANPVCSSSDSSSDCQTQRVSQKHKTRTERPSHRRRDRNNNMDNSGRSSTNPTDSQENSEPHSETTPAPPRGDCPNNNNEDQNANRSTANSNINENLNARSTRNDNENSSRRGGYCEPSPVLPRHRPALYRADSGFDADQVSDREDDEPSCHCGHDEGASSKTRRHASHDRHGKHHRHKSLSKSTPLLRKSSMGRCMSWTSLDSAMGGSCTSIDQRRDSTTTKGEGHRSNSLMLSCSSSSTSSTSLSSSLSSSMSSLWSAVSRSSLNWPDNSMDTRTCSSPDCSRVATPAPESSPAIFKPLDRNDDKVEQSVSVKEKIATVDHEPSLPKRGETESVLENKMEQNLPANLVSSSDVSENKVRVKSLAVDPPENVIQKDTEVEPSSGSTHQQPDFSDTPLGLGDSASRTSDVASSSSSISRRSRRPRRSSRDLNNNTNMHDGTRPQSYLPASVGRLGDCLQKNGVIAFIMLLTYTLTLMIGIAVISYIAKGVIAVIGEEDLKEMRKSLTQSRASRRSTATSG